MSLKSDSKSEKTPFEDAIDKTGFGAYSFIMLGLSSMAIMSMAFIGYGSMIIVPTSACELATTGSQQGLLAAAPVVGLMLGGIIWGYLADTRGRRAMLLLSLTGGALFNMIASISVNFIMLMILQLVASLSVSGVYSMSMALMSESVPMAKRNLMVLLVSSISLLSQGIMSVVAIPIIPLPFSIHLPALGIYWNSWRTLMVVFSCPSIITAIWLYFMEESPKFYFAMGDDEKTLDTLKVIHKINHFRSKEEFTAQGLLRQECQMIVGQSSAKDQIVPLFKTPFMKYIVIMAVLYVFEHLGAIVITPDWSQVAPCSLNVTSLLMVFGVGVLQAVVNILISLIIHVGGGRNIAMVVAAVCGVSGILVNLVPNAIGSAVLFAILLMGIVVLGLYTAIMVSLFPTHLRALAIAFAFSFGRIGTFASIQILNLLLERSCDVGFYLFSAIFASSAIVASFLPDDRRLQAPKSEAR